MSITDRCQESPVLHVVVVGFHHKKGCQVEYSYPPLLEGNDVNSSEVPPEWKHLASLAIPDGAHNYKKDTIYFHLPSRDGTYRTVYGVACYRQIDSSELVKKSSEVTRSTVQKSVCVLSRLPLYGLIQAKLELITHAYFKELDFSKVEVLEDTYKNLSLSLTESLRDGSQVFLGMSVRDVVTQFRHKIVLLFKLILLERRVLFTGAPVQTLCNTILAILSLFPGMIENGLEESASVELNRQLSPTLRNAMCSDSSEEFLEVCYHDEKVTITRSSPKKEKEEAAYTEPEELEIPRDGMDSTKKTENNDAKDENKNSSNVQDFEQSQCDEVQTKTVRSLSDTGESKSEKQTKSSRYNVKRTLSESYALDFENVNQASSSSGKSENSVSFSDDPLAHVKDITQLKAIQTGTIVRQLDSVVNVEEFNLEKLENLSDDEKDPPSKFEISLNLEDAREVLKRSEGVEELDSPESIQKIDQEDCFSWEEDRLLLTIEHKESISEVESSDQQKINQSDSKKQSCDTQDSGIDIGSPSIKEYDKTDSFEKESSEVTEKGIPDSDPKRSPGKKAAAIKNKISSAFSGLKVKKGSGIHEPTSPTDENSAVEMNVVLRSSKLTQDDCGFPLAVFTKGCVLHPYLSLQYFDLMSDVNVRSFVIGATNVLFRQKRHLTDIVIEVSESEEGKIDIHDRELYRLLHLTTADLRFADIIIKAVLGEDSDDPYLDGTEWEGGDEWIQSQFKAYLQSMLATMEKNDSKLLEDYGTAFCQAYRTTHNYRQWSGTSHPGMANVLVGHPCQGNLAMSDIKMRLSHNLQNTERGKKINAAMVQTGRYVEQAGKAVGGAIVNAKSAVSSWFSGWRNPKGDNLPPQS
ncbi:late secretory pathway protein AVL9 homolog [Saccostrea echinata]|uniref:late secretory pathway protein AVL9 homolog n=1 Tax=Saccostrea echinata TaxID=191078 RepID=UPI002A807394|nr:late secretory pathway protein AVL9 homolog [Saccostrea echinata]